MGKEQTIAGSASRGFYRNQLDEEGRKILPRSGVKIRGQERGPDIDFVAKGEPTSRQLQTVLQILRKSRDGKEDGRRP